MSEPTDPSPGQSAPAGNGSAGRGNGPAAAGGRDASGLPHTDRRDRGRPGPVAVLIGVLFVAVGVYSFVERTLAISLPPIHWGSLWPVALIVLGGVILLRSIERRS